jgi:hypothetical protein
MIRQLLIAWLAARINRHQDHVMTYLREENRILKAKLKGRRVQLTDTERRRLAVLAHPIDRKHLKDVSTIVTPDTLQRWYRRLVVQEPSRQSQTRPLGRPRVAAEIEQLVVRMANENPRWGYRRIQGALSNLGYDIDNTTVRNILRRNHIDPAPIRGKVCTSWSQFIKLHWEVLDVSGFFEAQLSAVVRLWTVLTELGGNLSARSIQLFGLIQHSTLSVATFVAKQCCMLWTQYLTPVDAPCRIVLGRQWRVHDGVLPTLRLVPARQVTCPPINSRVQPPRDPPAPVTKRPQLTVLPRYHARGEKMAAARFSSLSKTGIEDRQARHQQRCEEAFIAVNQAAA